MQGENERQWKKKVNENTYDISSIKIFWTFHVVVVQNNGKEMYKKSVLHVQGCLLIRPIVVFFSVLRRCLRRLALHDFIFCLNKL